MVASAGWWLLGWAALAAVVLQMYGSALAGTVAAVLAVCAIGVLRGERWYVVAAAAALAVLSLGGLVIALLNVPIVILLAGAVVRLRAADTGTDQARNPAAKRAGEACLVAAVAGVLWIAGWVGLGTSWEELLVLTAYLTLPALVLAVAAIGMVFGTPGWAFVATLSLVVFGLAVLTARVSEGVVAGWVPMDLALLGSAALAYVRLLRVARGAGLR